MCFIINHLDSLITLFNDFTYCPNFKIEFLIFIYSLSPYIIPSGNFSKLPNKTRGHGNNV